MEGYYLEILRGRGVSKAKVFKGKYEAKFEFPEGCGGSKPKQTFSGRGIDIFFLEQCNIIKA